MEIYSLESMKNGWFIGDFEPTLFQTSGFEVAIKKYKKGDYEKSHKHAIATEFTVIISGTVKMNENIFNSNTVIKILPGEYTDFLVLQDAITLVVKVPSVKNDKFS